MNTPTTSVNTAPAPTLPAAGRTRRRALASLAVVVMLCGIGYAVYWFLDARYFESTDDAYVNGDVVQITSEVPGTVIGLHVDDTQRVSVGQPVLELDPADAKIAQANAQADLARAVRQVRGPICSGSGTAGANRSTSTGGADR